MVPSLGNNLTGDNKRGCHREEGTLELQKLVGPSEQVLRSDANSQATICLGLNFGEWWSRTDRTVDLHNAIVALFQLSYGPIPKEGKELLNTLPSVNLLLGRERIDKQRIQRLFILV